MKEMLCLIEFLIFPGLCHYDVQWNNDMVKLYNLNQVLMRCKYCNMATVLLCLDFTRFFLLIVIIYGAKTLISCKINLILFQSLSYDLVPQ
jgi:hypothetical protein